MPEMPQDRLALDRASTRSKDQAGHLHVHTANISRAMVCPYRGEEIPGAADLGLDPNKIYNLLRDPEELAKAAASFENKPLMDTHRPQTANDHDHDVVVGSVSDIRWEPPFLKAALAVWDGEAIADIEAERKREISAGYYYKPDMTPGVYNGVSYEGIMRSIQANHVSLVSEGRAGPDVCVGDAALAPAAPSPAAPPAPAQPAAPEPTPTPNRSTAPWRSPFRVKRPSPWAR